jgi:hypothetical protein
VRRYLLALILLAFSGVACAQTDDPMLRWDCDPAGRKLTLEMVQPPVGEVAPREVYMFSGALTFEQCRLGEALWTLLVDIVEYTSGRCEVEPDTIVTLLRGERIVVSSVVVGYNCGERPVLSEARITEPADGGEPRLELCTARKYGDPVRCAPARPYEAVIDNERIRALAEASSKSAGRQ